MKCSFAFPGTYGHECGRPATHVAVKKSNDTVSGLFFAGRCAECLAIKGGENSDNIRVEPLNEATHRNYWKSSLFVGCFPTGLVYCDRQIEVNGDYKRIAYLNYGTLKLEIDDPKSPLLPLVQEDAARMQARRGELFAIAGNMSVTLGGGR